MTVQLAVNAGPPATSGPLTFQGSEAVEESYLRRLAEWPQGGAYAQRVLRDLQRQFSDTQLFSTVTADTGGEIAEPGTVPVTVTVVDPEHRSLRAAAAFSTSIRP